MSRDLKQAKMMFFEYACNFFYMDRNGVRGDYERFGVSKAQEKAWRQEYIETWVSRLSVDDLTAVDRLRDTWAVEALPDLIQLADSGDGFARLWVANAIWDLTQEKSIQPALRQQAVATAVRIWEDLADSAFTLTEDHVRRIIPAMSYLKADTPKAYVRNYARRKLEEARP